MSPNIDNPSYLLTLLTGGLTNGALYALVALAVVLVYKTTSHINLAQGEMATLGAFAVFELTRHGVDVWLAIWSRSRSTGLMASRTRRFALRSWKNR